MEKNFLSEGTETHYRKHAGKCVIELEFNSLEQLSNFFGPARFHGNYMKKLQFSGSDI